MADSNHGSLKCIQIILQHVQGLNIQIVGRLVQHQHIGRSHQDAQKIQPPHFAAGQASYFLVLHTGGKQESLCHLGGRQVPIRGVNVHCHIPHRINDASVRIQRRAMLGKIANLHRFAPFYDAACRGQIPHQGTQQGGFSCAVTAYDAKAVIPQKGIGKILNQCFAVNGNIQVLPAENLLAQSAGNAFHVQGLLRWSFPDAVRQLVKAFNPPLSLGAASLCAPANPCQFLAVEGFVFPQGGFRHFLPLGTLLQVAGIVTLVAIHPAAANVKDAVEGTLQQVSVVGHHHQGAAEAHQTVFQPLGHVNVNMVGRLIQQQHITRSAKHPGQCHSHFLTAGKGSHLHRGICKAQLGKNGLRLISGVFHIFTGSGG